MNMSRLVLLVVCCASFLVAPALGKTFVFRNNGADTVWIGTLGNAGQESPGNGGFVLNPGQDVMVTTEDDWAGRFWPRTGCDDNTGSCETGDCGGLQCNGAAGAPPATLAEFSLGDTDYYDVSLVDGFNVGVEVSPMNQDSCGTAGCLNDLNPGCPSDLQLTDSSGAVVGCKSSCVAYNTDQFCCRGDYNTPQTCDVNDWPPGNSAEYFKSNCPNAYSYAFDDPSSTYTCNDSGYTITIG